MNNNLEFSDNASDLVESDDNEHQDPFDHNIKTFAKKVSKSGV